MNARGYSLVEISIALVVLGLLLGATLVPLQVRYEREDRREVRQILQNASDAVIAYAVANRTLPRIAEDDSNITHSLPAGRPYLPCPDIDGDGGEDRTAITTTVAITLSTSVLVDEGVCMESKGLLPWRTLGLRQQSDPWGRRIGYRVDPAFSSEIMGFDETFRADIFDPRKPLTVTNNISYYQTRDDRDESGALVCSEFSVTPAVSCPDISAPNMPNLVAGVVEPATMTLTLTLGSRQVPAYIDTDGTDDPQGILEGAAFVVYSHGKNGRGGISAVNDERCVSFVGGTDGERANAFYRPPHPFLMPPFSCEDHSAADPTLSENLFFSAPENKRTGADDILMWTSPNSLIGALLQAGALPIPKLAFLPED